MASVSVSHLIIFIASMMIAASVAGVFTDTVGQLSSAVSEQGLDVSSDVRTDIEIISDSGSDAIYDSEGNGNITLHVKNTGSEGLAADPGELDVFVDGEFATVYTVTLVPNGGLSWNQGDVIRLEISTDALADWQPSGDHRVKVIVNGDEEVFEFRT
jgi:flagellar protein FlaG